MSNEIAFSVNGGAFSAWFAYTGIVGAVYGGVTGYASPEAITGNWQLA